MRIIPKLSRRAWLDILQGVVTVALIIGAFLMGAHIINVVSHYSDTKTILVINAEEYKTLQKSSEVTVVDFSKNQSEKKSFLESSIKKSDRDLKTTIADMQSATLAITALAVTFLTILTITGWF